MSDTKRQAIRSAELNVDLNGYSNMKTEHTGWEDEKRSDGEREDFGGVEPGEKVDWVKELDKTRDRLLELNQKHELSESEEKEKGRLQVRERKIEKYLNESG